MTGILAVRTEEHAMADAVRLDINIDARSARTALGC